MTAHERPTITFATGGNDPQPGPIERRLIHQPRHNWSPRDICPHVASVAVKGFKRGDYRQCLSCGAEVAA